MSSGGGKGGGGGTPTYDYYGTIAGVVGVGPVDRLVAIIIDNEKVWPASGTGIARGAEDYISITIPKYGNARFYWGTETQTTPTLLTAAGNNYAEEHPPMRGFAYILFMDCLMGRERTTAFNAEVVYQRKPMQTVITGGAANLDADGQANPIAYLAEILGDAFVGAGLASYLNPSVWQAAADALAAAPGNSYVSPLLDKQINAKAALADVQLVIDSWLRWNPTAGKLDIGIIPSQAAIDVEDLPLITSAQLTEKAKIDVEGWRDVDTRWSLTFKDRKRNFKQASVKVDNLRALQALNTPRPATIRRDMVTRKGQAQHLAAAWGRLRSIPGNSGELTVIREKAAALRIGDLFVLELDDAEIGISISQVSRVTGKTTPTVGPIVIEYTFDQSTTAVAYTPSFTDVTDDAVEIPEIDNFRILELPPLLAGKKEYRIAVFGERPDPLVTGMSVYYDDVDNGIFPLLGSQRQFALRGRLNAAYSAAATGVVEVELLGDIDRDILASVPAGDTSARNDKLLMFLVKRSETSPYIDIEEDADGNALVEVFSVSSSAFTGADVIEVEALRARRGTKALNHVITGQGTEVWFIARGNLDDFSNKDGDAAYFHADFPLLQEDGAYGYFRLQPETALGERELADCAVNPFRFSGSKTFQPLMTWTLPVNDSGKNFTTTPAPDALYAYGSTGAGSADSYDGFTASEFNAAPFAFDGRLVEIVVNFSATGDYTFLIASRNSDGSFNLVRSFVLTIAATGPVTIIESNLPEVDVLAGQYLGIYRDGTLANSYRYTGAGLAVGKDYLTAAGLVGAGTVMTTVVDAALMVQGTIRVSTANALTFYGLVTDRDSNLQGVQLLRNRSDEPALVTILAASLPNVSEYALYQPVDFPAAGTYRVTLRMVDDGGRVIERKRTIVVPPEVPVSQVEVAFASPSGGSYYKARSITITTDTALAQVQFKWTDFTVAIPPTTGLSAGGSTSSTASTTMQLNKRLWFRAQKSGLVTSDWMFEDYFKAT